MTGDPVLSDYQRAARLLGLELDFRLVPAWVIDTRGRCPLSTDPGYAPVGPCALTDDGTDCPMAGIASGCAFEREGATDGPHE